MEKRDVLMFSAGFTGALGTVSAIFALGANAGKFSMTLNGVEMPKEEVGDYTEAGVLGAITLGLFIWGLLTKRKGA